MIKAPNAFDADGFLKAPSRGWFTPAQIEAMQATKLKASAGHVWIWFDPFDGDNLVEDAETVAFPKKTNDKLIKLMREYHRLNRTTDHEMKKSKQWAASHSDHYKQYQHNYNKSREFGL